MKLHTAIAVDKLQDPCYLAHMERFQSWRPKLLRVHNETGWQFADLSDFFSFAGERALHGGCLIAPNALRPWIWQLSPEQAWAATVDWIEQVVGGFPKLTTWDVVNEAFPNGQQMRRVPWAAQGETWWMDEAFRIARAANPKATLYLKDFRPQDSERWSKLFEYVEGALTRGIPIDGIAVQLHCNWLPSGIRQLKSALYKPELTTDVLEALFKRIQSLGLRLNLDETITWDTFCLKHALTKEVAIARIPEPLFNRFQAQAYREWRDLAQHYNAQTLGFWSPWDGDSWHWKRGTECFTGLWRSDWSSRPAAAVFFPKE